MLSLDPVTRAEYDAAETPAARAAVVMAAITGTVTATVYDGSDVARGSGTMQTPWASIEGTRLVIGELSSFMVTNGGTPDANWYLAFEAGTRWMRGSFGLSGADFNWSLATFATGQSGRLGTVEVQAQGYEPVEGPYSAQWNLMTFAQASLSPSWSVADGSAQALDASGVPNPIQINQGGTFDLTPYVVGGVPPYTAAVAVGYSLPTGVTLTGPMELSAAIDAPLTGEPLPTVKFDIDDSAVAATLPTFGVLSSVGGSNLPFAFGHVFAQGDVPSGSYVDSDLTDWQCVPTTTWPDGSLRHAIIAGRATCTQNVRKDIALSVSGTNRSGTALTQTNLAAALPTVTVQGGSHTTTLNSLVGTAAKHRTVCTGPIMSNWIYRHAVTSSNHLVVWIDVRLYKGGRVEIFPWVENAYLTVANPTNDVRTWTVTIGGTQVFSQSIDIKHHTRIPLISGSTFSYWTTDPGIVPVHDTDYMMASKMVPNYGWTSPSSATLETLQQSYTPNTLAGISTSMGAAGSSAAILNKAQALYCTSGDVRAYRAAIAFGLSGGSWSIHYRAEATSTQGVAGWPNEPARFASYPSISINIDGSPEIPNGTGATNGEAVTTHQPSYGYLPWLLTGRWWFLEESLFWAIYNYVKANPTQRRGWSYGASTYYAVDGSAGIIDPNNGTYAVRGAAWALRTLAQTLVILPSDHPCFGSLKIAWEQSIAYLNADRVTGTWSASTRDEYSPIGIIGDYSDTVSDVGDTIWGNPGWMSQMIAHVLGWCRELNLPQTTGAELESLAAHALKLPVVLSGDGSAGAYNYRRFSTYSLPVAAQSGGQRGAWYTTGQQMFDALESAFSLAELGGGTSLKQHTSNLDLVGDSNDSTWPYFGQAYAALSYAVDNGVTGATAGRARILAASNYPSVALNFNNDPVYGIVPRSV